MTILVVGGTGATGKLVLEQLLNRNMKVRAIVRDRLRIPEHIRDHHLLEIVEGSLLGFNDAELKEFTRDCSAIVSCLGHNLSFKGLFGPPFRLVKQAVKRLTTVAQQHGSSVKFILMNTTGVSNPEQNERRSLSEKLVVGILTVLLPPQADNAGAAKYLQVKIGKTNPHIQWVSIRPDSLIDLEEVSEYTVHPSPVRSAIFDPRKTSRINVAHFMAELIEDEELWEQSKFQMPVLYNSE